MVRASLAKKVGVRGRRFFLYLYRKMDAEDAIAIMADGGYTPQEIASGLYAIGWTPEMIRKALIGEGFREEYVDAALW